LLVSVKVGKFEYYRIQSAVTQASPSYISTMPQKG